MNTNDKQIARMLELMSYGIENKEDSKPSKSELMGILEYHTKGADGKTYGIVREGHNFYIKCAPQKDTEVLLEDYEYIGGVGNKSTYQYKSYTQASKNLEMKLMAINEACGSQKPIVEMYNPDRKDEDFMESLSQYSEEIARQREIMRNAAAILGESANIGSDNVGVPEAPKTSQGSPAKQGQPFTIETKAELDKDSVAQSKDHTKKAPFDENGEVTDADMQDDSNPKCNGNDCGKCDCEDAKYVPSDAVVNKKPKGGKVVKVNEGKHTILATEEQVLAWSHEKDKLDTSTETEIGDTAPFTEKPDCQKGAVACDESEGTAMYQQSDNINKPTPGEGEVGDAQPFDKKVNEGIMEDDPNMSADNYAGFDDSDEDVYSNADLDFEREWNEWLQNGAGEGNMNGDNDFDNEPTLDDEEPIHMDYDPTYGMDNPYESAKKDGKAVNEDKLDVFGKTPGYRKKPMTTPPNVEVAPNGSKDWNDDSVKGEQPFGQKIGDASPFTDIVKDITDAVVNAVKNRLGDKKKD